MPRRPDVIAQIGRLKSELSSLERRRETVPISQTRAQLAALQTKLAELERKVDRDD